MPRKWVIMVPVIAGIAAFVVLKKSSTPPVQEPRQEQATLVRVISTPEVTLLPRAEGHGSVQPSRSWDAIAQIKGRVIEKHPRLQKGAILEAQSLVLRIDPTDYELAIAQAKADIQATRAQLQELEVKAGNTRASLRIEQEALALSRKELERKRKLVDQGGVSRSDLESQERNLLSQQQSVQAQISLLNLFPSEKALLKAQLSRLEASLDAARRNLAHTEIRLPFTSRIAEVQVEQDQYVREGETLLTADDLQQAEIQTQIPINQMNALIQSNGRVDLLSLNPEQVMQQIGLTARVTLEERDVDASWDARFARISDTLDPKTRTVGVIVEVDKPYANVRPGVHPPLAKGLFVKVTLTGKPRPASLVVPRSALHRDRLYVVNAEQRLEIREVVVGIRQAEFISIERGLTGGEQVVISDLVPAIEGMLLKPVDDPERAAELVSLASGEPHR